MTVLLAASPFAPSRYRGIGSNLAFRETKGAGDLSVVHDVVLLRAGPGNLGQRHYYSEKALQDSVAREIFEGAQCYLNHPTTIEEQTIPERSVEKLAGYFSDVTVRPYTDPEFGKTTALYADFHPRVGDDRVLSIVRTCLEYAKRYPRMAWAGLSIYARGESVPIEIDGEQWNRVDRIDEVDSVDIVTRAGAGGTIVALRESEGRMKVKKPKGSRTARATESGDVAFTLDADKIREGLTTLVESGKKERKAALVKIVEAAQGGVKVSPEQDQEIDRQLGIVDGGKIDKVLDDATGVADPEDDDEEGAVGHAPGCEDDECEGCAPTVEAGDEDAAIEAMPDQPAFLKKQIKKEREARVKAQSQAAAASTRAREATARANTQSRERMAENVMTALNIPDTFRPRLKHELVTGGFVHEKGMREHAQAFDKAFIRPQLDGAGIVSGGRVREGAASTGNFNFDEEA
jgi:hypothetical protein